MPNCREGVKQNMLGGNYRDFLKWVVVFRSFSYNNFMKTKFLVKIFQFEFLVMIEKNVFAYKLFLPLNISNFSLSFL